MRIRALHEWTLSPQDAIALQKTLAARVIHDQAVNIDAINLVGGVDVSVKNNVSQAAVVVMAFPGWEVIETARAQRPAPFPYVPGLLSFREGPVLVEAFTQLQNRPDVFIFDGMGRIHPRRLGIASHLGLWLETPTVGCGKNHLIGDYESPGAQKGDYSLLSHQQEVLGAVLRTRMGVKPVYISPGHLIDLDSSIDLILRCAPKYRLPEPIRAAHKAAGL